MKWLILIVGIVFAAVIATLEIWKRLIPEQSRIVKKIEITIVIIIFVVTVVGVIKEAFSPSDKEMIKKTVDAVIEKKLVPLEEVKCAYEEVGRLKEDLASALRRAEELEHQGVKEAKGVIEELRKSGDLSQLLKILEEDRNTYRNQLVERNREIAAVAYLKGDINIASEAIEEILKIQPNDLNALTQKGHIYELRGELIQAEEIYTKVLEQAENNKNDRWQAVAANGLGNIYQTRHEFNKAEEMYKKALGFNEKLGELGGVAINYNNLGIVYEIRGEWGKAEDAYRKALTIAEKMGDKEKMANINGNLGNVYLLRGEIDKAENAYRKILEFYKKLSYQRGIAFCYGNLGLVYRGRGELFEAEKMHNKALEVAERIGDKEMMAISYHSLGIVFADRGDLQKAKEYWVKARDLYEKIGVPQMVKEVQGRIDSAESEKKLNEIDQKVDKSIGEEYERSEVVKKTLKQREKELEDAIGLLNDAISQVDNGNFQYFKVISAQLRGLIGMGRNSNPLLLNLAGEKGIKLECYAFSATLPEEIKDLEQHIALSVNPGLLISVTPVSRPSIKKWEFKKWLETPVFVMLGDRYTPNEIIRLVAEKEGGAHYDDALPERLLKIKGFVYHTKSGEYNETDRLLYQTAIAVTHYGKKILEN